RLGRRNQHSPAPTTSARAGNCLSAPRPRRQGSRGRSTPLLVRAVAIAATPHTLRDSWLTRLAGVLGRAMLNRTTGRDHPIHLSNSGKKLRAESAASAEGKGRSAKPEHWGAYC